MPVPVGTIIAAGAAVASTAGNAYMTGRTNRKTREFSKEMYNRQREHALADYNMQNDYNSPTSQMQRLREAGLNPNLIYGSSANAGEASPVRSSQAPPWNPHAPQVDAASIGESIGKYYDVQKTKEETDNLKKQNTVLAQEALLKDAQRTNVNADTASKLVQTDTGKFRLELESVLRQNTLDARDADLRKTNLENEKISAETKKVGVDTQFTLNQDERNASANSSSLQEAAARILSMRYQNAKSVDERKEINKRIDLLKVDEALKQEDLRLKKAGIQPHDPAYQRAVQDFINKNIIGNDFDSKGVRTPKSGAIYHAPWKPY